jgi:flagellar biosynthesis protein FliQ
MNDATTIDLVQTTLLVTMKIVLPILAAGLVVGLVVSIFQAITSMQEQTLAIVPKIIAMLAVTVLLTPWIFGKLMEFTREMLTSF